MADLGGITSVNPGLESPEDQKKPWYQLLNRYHVFVLVVAALGWLFDCLDQQLFVLARGSAMRDLLRPADGVVTNALVDAYSAYATSVFMLGWAVGGLVFGVLGDRIGRAKTMMLTILIYSAFTGLSALSQNFYDFCAYRFLTGLGVGGEFAVGVALVAEVMPNRARPYCLSLLQALSAVGNISAAFISIGLGSQWRWMFVIGALPALLALVVRFGLKEPEQWQQAVSSEGGARQLGSYSELFGDPRWRKNAMIGLAMAFAGVVGLWAVVFFAIDLVGHIARNDAISQEMTDVEIGKFVGKWKGIASFWLNIGAGLGMFGFGLLAQWLGRKTSFAIAYTAAGFSTAAVFLFMHQLNQIYFMFPLMGFCVLSLFSGYAIYFPELFPTRLRSTGTSFCYNVGRFVAASGPVLLGLLTEKVFANSPEPLRPAGLSMCAIFAVGLLVLPFAPETKDQPLPE